MFPKLTFLLLAALVLFADSPSVAQNFWEPVGNTTPSTASAITIEDDGTIIASDGNIFISNDEGLTWQEPQPDSPWDFAAMWKSPNSHLFGEDYNRNIYRSTDVGFSWQLIPNVGAPFTVDSLGDLIAGWAAQVYMQGFPHQSSYDFDTLGVMISTDEGLSWQYTALYEWIAPYEGPNNTFNQSIAFAVDKNNNIFAGISNGIIFKSSDKTNWNRVSADTLSEYGNLLGVSLNGTPFASCNNGLFRLDDSNWTQLQNAPTDSAEVSSLTVSPNGTLFITTYSILWPSDVGLFRSTDNGNTWESLDSELKSQFIKCIAINSTGNSIYAGTDYYGLEESTDNGNTWTVIGHGLGTLYNLNISQNGTLTTGSSYSTDLGSTWFPIEVPINTNYSTDWQPIMGNSLYLWDYVDCLRTSDFGSHWDLCDSGLPASIDSGNVWGPVTDGCGNLYLYSNEAIPNRMFFSSDSGSSWHESAPGIPGAPECLISDRSCNIFVGSSSGIFRSTDGCKNWKQTNAGLTDSDIYALAIDKNGNIFAASGSTRIFCSKDDGDTWQNVSRLDTTEGEIAEMSMLTDAQNYLYLGYVNYNSSPFEGVYRSTDEGMSWDSLNSGLSDKSVRSLALSPNGYVFVETESGLYRSVNPTLDAVQSAPVQPSSILLTQNSPNPVTQSTTISFTLPEPSYITLTIYDATGREVAALANGFMDAGEHEVPFQRGNTPSGVYFYRLESGGSSQTRGMVVLP